MVKKRLLIAGTTLLTAATIAGMTALNSTPAKSGADTSPVVQQLSNHEVRIKNAENNIKDLQAKTNTPDSSSNAIVPTSPPVTDSNVSQGIVSAPTSLATTAPETTVQPTSIVVVAYKEIPLDGSNSDCEYTYSDGSKHQFAWKRTTQQGAWITDGSGQNGHWQPTVSYNGQCSDQAIGQLKVS